MKIKTNKFLKKDKKNTTHPNGFLKMFKVKSTSSLTNTLFSDKIDWLVSPFFKYFLCFWISFQDEFSSILS